MQKIEENKSNRIVISHVFNSISTSNVNSTLCEYFDKGDSQSKTIKPKEASPM